jgi:hypothetical protein
MIIIDITESTPRRSIPVSICDSGSQTRRGTTEYARAMGNKNPFLKRANKPIEKIIAYNNTI